MARATRRRIARRGWVAGTAAVLTGGVGWVCLGGCQRTEYVPISATEAAAISPEELRARELPSVIAGYDTPKHQFRVPTDIPRWALELCTAFPRTHPSGFHRPVISRSDDARTHGQKMTLFYSSHIETYAGLGTVPSNTLQLPEGMYVVKETWTAEEIPASEVPESHRSQSQKYIVEESRAWKRKERSNTFVMYKPPADSPLAAETDAGWIYAVLTPDAKTVTESGRIATCMECHQEAKHERLFGVR